MELVGIKEMPKVLAKYEKVIKKVEKVEKEKGVKNPENTYSITLIKAYKINGKETDMVKASTLKEARKAIRSNKVLSTFKKENAPKTEKPAKKVEAKKEAKPAEKKTK